MREKQMAIEEPVDVSIRMGERAMHATTTLRMAAESIETMANELTREGCVTHTSTLRAAIGSVKDAIRSVDHATQTTSRELAAKLAAALPGVEGGK